MCIFRLPRYVYTMNTRFFSQAIWLIISIAILALVLLWLLEDPPPDKTQTDAALTQMPVTVLQVQPTEKTITHQATGITQPRWTTDMIATVGGRVVKLDEKLEPSMLVSKGDVLVRLLDTAYQSELEAAKARVANAKLELATIKNEQKVLRTNNKTAFGRREPHLHAAQANLNAARAALKAAQQQVKDTIVTAPFDAIILQRHVSPSMWINQGDVLFKLAASDSINIEVELARSTWQRLGDITDQLNISILTPSNHTFPASIRYLNPIMDNVTRQRGMMLKVANPYIVSPPLLAGQQVTVEFQGRNLSQVVSAPSSVLTEDGKVWTVQDDVLGLENIELLSEQPEYILFRFAQSPDKSRQLVRYPLGTMLEGQTVTPKVGVWE